LPWGPPPDAAIISWSATLPQIILDEKHGYLVPPFAVTSIWSISCGAIWKGALLQYYQVVQFPDLQGAFDVLCAASMRRTV
jgi:hypothetical protein